MTFPKVGHTRTRGMFRTLDAPEVRLATTRFAPRQYVPVKLPLVGPLCARCWSPYHHVSDCDYEWSQTS